MATLTVQARGGEVPSAAIYVDRVRYQGAGGETYAAGGIAFGLATALPGKTILGAVQMGAVAGASVVGSVALYDRANDQIELYTVGGAGGSFLAELTAGVSTAALDVTFLVFSE